MSKTAPAQKPLTKSQIIAEIAEKQGLPKATVQGVLDALQSTVAAQLGKKGPGIVLIPGLLKLRTVEKPATAAREGINPFTKQKQKFAAKPASRKVKAAAIKALKDAVA
jgi:nucleoid DNA-binding protein